MTIKNVWFPSDYTAPLDPNDARNYIESEKLVVAGTAGASTSTPYTVKIDFLPDAGDNLTVKSLGVWLPQGYVYTLDSCSLQDDGPFEVYYPDDIMRIVIKISSHKLNRIGVYFIILLPTVFMRNCFSS